MSLGGKDTVIKHGTHGATGTLTAFTTKLRGANLDLEAETVESTVFSDAYRDYEMSFKSGKIPLTYKYDNTVWGQLTAIYDGSDTVSFEVNPIGTTTGYPKVTFTAFMTKLSLPMQVGNLMEISADWQIDGAVTFGSN